jgi:membrane protein YdbS with pleckstrin-like domain
MAIAPILIAMVLVLIAALVGVIFYNQNSSQLSQYIPQWTISLIGFGLLAFIFFLVLGTIWIWRRNKVIITNQHIVDVDQIGLFNQTVSTLRLEEIQDISASIKGPMQTLFRYGTIIVQTAGERPNFVFDYVPNPYEIEHYILEIRKDHPGGGL